MQHDNLTSPCLSNWVVFNTAYHRRAYIQYPYDLAVLRTRETITKEPCQSHEVTASQGMEKQGSRGMHAATKIVIITERSILEGVADLLESHGVTGYTYTAAGGKGSRGKRRMGRVPQVNSILENVKIEAIVPDHDTAEQITAAVVDEYFDNYSGITYTEPVQILRPGKFKV